MKSKILFFLLVFFSGLLIGQNSATKPIDTLNIGKLTSLMNDIQSEKR